MAGYLESRIFTLEQDIAVSLRRLAQAYDRASRVLQGTGFVRAGDGGGCSITYSFAVQNTSGFVVSGATVTLQDSSSGSVVGTATTDGSGAASIRLTSAGTYAFRVSGAGYADSYGTMSPATCGDVASVGVVLYGAVSTSMCGSVPDHLRLDDLYYGITTPLVWDGSTYWTGCGVVNYLGYDTCAGGYGTPVFYYLDTNFNLRFKFFAYGTGAYACPQPGDCTSIPNHAIPWSDGAGSTVAYLASDSGSTCDPLNYTWNGRGTSLVVGDHSPYAGHSVSFRVRPPF